MARGGGQDLPHAGMLSSAKASQHGARAKRFVPRRNAPLGEGLPTRRTSERICPAGFAFRSTCRRTAGRPRPTDSRKNTPSAGSHPRGRGRCRVHSPKKIRLLHETQFFYGESHVGSRPIFPSFPSVGRCVARERNPVPPVAPHCGSGHRGLRRDGEMCHGFGEMVRRFGECPHGGKSLPRGARAKGFASREKVLLGKGLPTRRTGEGICPAGFAFAPRADERRAALGRRTARKTPLRRGRTHSARPLPSSFTEKNKTTP